MAEDRPGSDGEHELQRELGSHERATDFYDESVHDHLTDRMQEFVADRIMFFLSTADGDGETDCSPRLGPKGFVQILDDETLCYPEYRGNGVQASLGNIRENPHASMLFVDWWETTVGLHVNGDARIREERPDGVSPESQSGQAVPTSDDAKLWVELEVEEAYIHCAKHIPKLRIESFDPPWGTDDEEEKRAGFFAEE